jgi:pimeloyl-ACP methyl ester carboxylesterase
VAESMAAGVAVDKVGAGEPVLLVHGTVISGKATWRMQRPLADRWRLLVMERRGYAPSPPGDREDYDRDTEDVVAVLGDYGPAHLVGHSYGAIAVLKAAAAVPALVRSLTVIEPPVFAICLRDPQVAEMVAGLEALFETGPSDGEGFLRQFWSVTKMGSLPDPLPPVLAENAPLLMGQRPPWTAGIPTAHIAAGTYPKLVVSGGHNLVFDLMSQCLADGVGGRLVTLPGEMHSPQRLGPAFNDELEAHLRIALGTASAARGGVSSVTRVASERRA